MGPSYICPETCRLSTGRGEAGLGPPGVLEGTSMAGRQCWFPGVPGRLVQGEAWACSCTAGQATIIQLPLPGRLGGGKTCGGGCQAEVSLVPGIAGKCSLPGSSQLPELVRGSGMPSAELESTLQHLVGKVALALMGWEDPLA